MALTAPKFPALPRVYLTPVGCHLSTFSVLLIHGGPGFRFSDFLFITSTLVWSRVHKDGCPTLYYLGSLTSPIPVTAASTPTTVTHACTAQARTVHPGDWKMHPHAQELPPSTLPTQSCASCSFLLIPPVRLRLHHYLLLFMPFPSMLLACDSSWFRTSDSIWAIFPTFLPCFPSDTPSIHQRKLIQRILSSRLFWASKSCKRSLMSKKGATMNSECPNLPHHRTLQESSWPIHSCLHHPECSTTFALHVAWTLTPLPTQKCFLPCFCLSQIASSSLPAQHFMVVFKSPQFSSRLRSPCQWSQDTFSILSFLNKSFGRLSATQFQLSFFFSHFPAC